MSSQRNVTTFFLQLLLFIAMPIIIHSVNTDCDLKVGFYAASCPQAEVITSKIINEVIAIAPSLSGPLLRMFFHDCFVRVSFISIKVYGIF